MRYLGWTIRLVILTFVVAFLHYTLPDRDIVYVTGVDTKREDLGENAWFWAGSDAGAGAATSRDVRFIDSVQRSGRVKVYRNEDTGWRWPPYLKFNSADLQAKTRNLVSTQADPQWVIVTHYGWRNVFFSIYPNAISIRPIEDPDVRLIPWFNIVVLTVLFAIWWGIRVRWIRFREARIDPITEDIGDSVDDAREGVGRFFGRKSS